MVVVGVLTAFYLAAVIIFHYCAIRKGPVETLKSKAAASILFVAIGAAVAFGGLQAPDGVGSGFILMGLFMGLAGDVLLALRNIWPAYKTHMIGAGMGAFALGHIAYAFLGFMLAGRCGIHPYLCALPLVLGIAFAAVYPRIARSIGFDFGKLGKGIVAYGFIIIVMVAFFVMDGIAMVPGQPLFAVLPLAALLFASSDMLLSKSYFGQGGKPSMPGQIIAIHVTYYAAQYMFAIAPMLGLEGK